jgi:hypothetical protein
MNKIFTLLRALVAALVEPGTPADPISRMCPRELADLPTHHPRT